MKEQGLHHLSDKIKTFITNGFFGWQAGFTVEQQTFYLQPVSSDKGDQDDTKARAEWYQNSLEFAIKKVMSGEYESPSTDVSGLKDALERMVQAQKKQYQSQKDEADWFNNNMPGVGQTHDYKTYPSLPDWVAEIENILSQYSTLTAPADEEGGVK